MSNALLTPYRLADGLELKNRTVMSAMTRSFAPQHLATDAMRAYYAKRAEHGVGLILTEGVVVHPSADGYNDVPHIATEAQAQSWIPVIAAVHAHGARIACQLWHCGRISHEDYTGGVPPVSSTDVAASGINRQNNKPYGTPHALTPEEMPAVHGYVADAARRALAVGFDAVQLHLGHGYLADQFFDARINDRSDQYGGSVENRCRFALEQVAALLAAVPADKVIVRLSPSRDMGGIYDWPDLDAMLAHLIPALWQAGVRMLDISCARADYYQTSGRIIRQVRPMWPGLLMGGASLTAEQGAQEVSDGLLELVTFGRAFIANPDLVRKIEAGEAFAPFDPKMLAELN
jgi:2,4-dienoyl-CoA reductase-like NADH-dependent reductase (Old Yellow Enzyme family)